MAGFEEPTVQPLLAALARWFDELAPALAAFQQALDALGMAGQVTTFTLSDFNRTFRINANAGTDHAWGDPQLVLGGAVKGGAFYGSTPDLAMGVLDDASDNGAWIPARRSCASGVVPV